MMSVRYAVVVTGLALLIAARGASAQAEADTALSGSALFVPNTPNIKLLSHIPLGRSETISGIAMDQDMKRPYVYVSRMQDPNSPAGFS
ncbi:MAG TPA: hypothetical protein VK511_12485, partial [Gemmatimonadaceae bacterium]|nr:hypothetical protein [Gemmatimonadaceae bacterium]